MQGSIRLFLGFLMVYGAVGTLDADPTASLLVQLGLAIVGLVVMASGALALSRNPR